MNHLIEVANLVAESTEGKPDAAVAALLHGVVEDQGVTTDEIANLFGDSVASLVAEVTDDKLLPKQGLCCKPCHRLSGWGVREEGERAMSEFKGRHFEGEIVLWAVRWYCRYGISYRDLEQMMGERGVSVDHSTIYRWVQRYAPEIEKRLRGQWRGPRSTSWRVDETYVKVRGQWTYLYRAVDKHGNTMNASRRTRSARGGRRCMTGLWRDETVIDSAAAAGSLARDPVGRK